MGRAGLSCKIGLVGLLAEDWGPFRRALQSPFAFSGRRTLAKSPS